MLTQQFKNGFAFSLPKTLLALVEEKVTNDGTTTINLRDSDYSQASGGYRPVEINVEKSGDEYFISYLTDFTYSCDELVKGCDFDFDGGWFSSDVSGRCKIDADVMELFELYANNLGHYLALGSFDVIETSHDTYTSHLVLSS